ncbi:MAG: membrane protein [Cyclobacteriaceae bacterium]|jgi:membrane protein
MLKSQIQRIYSFLNQELWEVKLSSLTPIKAWLFRQLRIILITVKEYNNDKCVEKASALTYFTLLSVVPVIAMAFGIATAFGLEKYMRRELERYFNGQQEVLDYMLKFADSTLNNTSGGIISGISSLFLIYAVARLLHNIERSFNDIWNTNGGRTFQRKLADYMSIMLLGPVILVVSSTATVFITTQLETLAGEFAVLGGLKGPIMFLLNLIPYTLIWLLLFLVYIIFPNTKVKIKPALVAGVIAGTVYQLTQWLYITFQVGVSSYSAVYGSFAAFPLFLIWVNISWLIVFFGAEYSFAVQNVDSWKFSSEALRINYSLKKKLYLLILKLIVDDFKKGLPTSFVEIDRAITLPTNVLSKAVQELASYGLINKLESQDEGQYQPAIDINQLSISSIIERIEQEGIKSMELNTQLDRELQSIEKKLNELHLNVYHQGGDSLLTDL